MLNYNITGFLLAKIFTVSRISAAMLRLEVANYIDTFAAVDVICSSRSFEIRASLDGISRFSTM